MAQQFSVVGNTESVFASKGAATDLNDANESGAYHVRGAVGHLPTGVSTFYGVLNVFYGDNDLITQILSNGSLTYTRRRLTGTWEDWYKIGFKTKSDADLASVVAENFTHTSSAQPAGSDANTFRYGTYLCYAKNTSNCPDQSNFFYITAFPGYQVAVIANASKLYFRVYINKEWSPWKTITPS